MLYRTIPDVVRREVDRQESAETYPVFLRISHRDLAEDIRVVSDPENYVLNGLEYTGFEFDIKLLSDGEGMPKAQLSVQNVDRKIGQTVLKVVDPVRLEIQIVAGSQFDVSVFPRVPFAVLDEDVPRMYRAKQLYLTEVEGDEMTLTGTIRSWDYTQETWPAIRATESRFPGLYW